MTKLDAQLANCRDYWLAWGWSDRMDGDITCYRSGLPHGQLGTELPVYPIHRLVQHQAPQPLR
jgi:hypothetical protein